MNNTRRSKLAAWMLVSALVGFWGLKAGAAANENAKTAKSKFIIMSSHTPEQCLKALDEVNAQGPKALSKYDWGCMSGDHTGYMEVSAANEKDALNMVPASMRGSAKVVKLNKFTPVQIKAFHEKK